MHSQARFADIHAAEVSRLQGVRRQENSALHAKVSRLADIFDSIPHYLMTETSWVRDAAKMECLADAGR
ncbi:hypothetical protein SFA35_19960 [Pseudomonas sp. HR96]|uniref:hypothetical protein n=1 Tax=Pseudomonas sp. HR96 TaxID=1027966 RepID=UPI002A75C740|nr:hypothetical protein [Pseudomonas sp. HR96]WPO98872.1 hypothetical protein SFA35_19960 [Pseudomonas sp. HR96]